MGYSDPDKQREYQRQWAARRRAEYFADKYCVQCGSVDDLELDHVDPSTKDPKLKKWRTGAIWSWSQQRRDAEIAKCQVLCARCHKAKTEQDFQYHTKHGTSAMYDRGGCRCPECRAFKRERNRQYRASRR